MGQLGAVLYLMRHGAAEDSAPSGRDADRSLTPAGRAAVRRVALALRDLDQSIERVIASPLARAQETAEIVKTILCPQVEIDSDEDLCPDGSAYDLALRAAALPGDTLLVGHQPNIEMVARALVRVHPPAAPAAVRDAQQTLPRMPAGFRTATIVGFHVGGRPPPYQLAVALEPANLGGG